MSWINSHSDNSDLQSFSIKKYISNTVNNFEKINSTYNNPKFKFLWNIQ